ncbi:hypothetical protein L560_1282 [Bordetella pertussis STO1-CHOC-0018]|nr:hypothetical protein L560_1282 [Bordetella pertussis STO1-CHOC-0018]
MGLEPDAGPQPDVVDAFGDLRARRIGRQLAALRIEVARRIDGGPRRAAPARTGASGNGSRTAVRRCCRCTASRRSSRSWPDPGIWANA